MPVRARLLDRVHGPLDQEAPRTGQAAGRAGWPTDGENGGEPTGRDVASSFSDSRDLMELLGLLDEDGDWANRHYRLTPAGETTVLAMLRTTAAGPREQP